MLFARELSTYTDEELKAMRRQFADDTARVRAIAGEQADRVLGKSAAGPLAALQDEQDDLFKNW